MLQYKGMNWAKSRKAIAIIIGVPLVTLALTLMGFLQFNGFSPHRAQNSLVSGQSKLAVTISAKEVLTLVNDVRIQHGLPALVENAQLDASAQAKCDDMLARGYFEHVTPDGKQPWTFIQDAGYKYAAAAENLSRGYSSSQEVVNGWVGSPGHYENMLRSNMVETGVAYCSNGTTHDTVQHFAKPQ